eukprot:scaffold13645_cov58-Phaeocystis_antarctica.AAC.6
MSAAAHAASVAPCTAIPTSAFLSAGASLTPSPVMPTVQPRLEVSNVPAQGLDNVELVLRVDAGEAICDLDQLRTCSGSGSGLGLGLGLRVRVGVRVRVRMSSAPGASGSVASGRSASWTAVPIPSMRQVSLAMAIWSPVTILTPTPRLCAASMVDLVSGRGGSRKVIRPMKHHRCRSSVRATAMQRTPRHAKSST